MCDCCLGAEGWHQGWNPCKFQSLALNWNSLKFYGRIPDIMLPVRGISGAIHTEERIKSRSLLWPMIRMNPALQTQLNQNCWFLLEMGQPCSWGIIKMHCLGARSAWIFKITIEVEYRTEVSLDFITKNIHFIQANQGNSLRQHLGSWLCGYRCTTYIQQDLYQHSSSQAMPLMEIALLADRAASVIKTPGKAWDTAWTLSRS